MLSYKNAATDVSSEAFDESYMDGDSRPFDNNIALWDIESIKADPEGCGLSGSPTKVKKIESVILSAGDIKMVDNTVGGIAEMVHELIADHTIG
jgi:electron transfer flavoprotein beta subunit